MVMCFVPDCKHYSERENCRYYTFPKDQNEARKWISAIRRADRTPSKHSLVCSCHFKDGIKKNGPSLFSRNSKKYMQFPAESKKRKPIKRLSAIRCNESYEMDTKIEIKEEDPLSQNVALQNEKKLVTKNITLITNSDAVLLNDCEMPIKTEIKLETPFPDFCSQKEREFCTDHLVKPIRCHTVTCSNNCRTCTKTRISSQKEGESLPVMKIETYNSDHEMDNKIEIKEEPWWLETETSSVCDKIKNEDFTPVKSPSFRH